MNEQNFSFRTKFDQTILLGKSAKNVSALVGHIRSVPGSSIYFHTHRFLQQHHYLSPESPNDFAYWATTVLGERILGEKIAGIDIIQYNTIEEFRVAVIDVLQSYLGDSPRMIEAPAGQEFYFMASKTFIVPTPYVAHTLADFRSAVTMVSIHSLYYHMFDAHLRHERGENDFSLFFRTAGEMDLADEIARLDPYSQTLEGLRQTIIRLLEKYDRH